VKPIEGYSPADLPPISRVEVVDLRAVDPPRVSDFMKAAAGAPKVTVQGPTAHQIAQLWRGLPPGDQMRCHIPPFGIRFFMEEHLVCQGSICWECNNVYGDAGGIRFAYEFDAGSAESQTLLVELGRIMSR
jgi:hypothetical protein